jgi:hypothetical protein
MAKKATKKTAKKAAAKKAAPAKKATKKATKKVAAKKTAKKAAKKPAKKATKKVVAVEQELDLANKPAPNYEELQEAAYYNYIERLKQGKPGTPELDWAKAEKDLG